MIDWRVILTAFVAGMALFALFSWGPVARRLNLLEPKDPEKGLRLFFLVGVVLSVLLCVVISLALLVKVLSAVLN